MDIFRQLVYSYYLASLDDAGSSADDHDGRVALRRLSDPTCDGSSSERERVIWSRCNLLFDFSAERLMHYSQIRDDCRRDAHLEKMWDRRRELMQLLRNVNDPAPDPVQVSRSDSRGSLHGDNADGTGRNAPKIQYVCTAGENEASVTIGRTWCWFPADVRPSVRRAPLESFLRRHYCYCSCRPWLPCIIRRLIRHRPPPTWSPPGSVPFLLGLVRLFDTQSLSQEETGETVRWTIDANVLTEVCCRPGGKCAGNKEEPLESFVEDSIATLLAPFSRGIGAPTLRLIEIPFAGIEDVGIKDKATEVSRNPPEQLSLALEVHPRVARGELRMLRDLCKEVLRDCGSSDVRASGSFSTCPRYV